MKPREEGEESEDDDERNPPSRSDGQRNGSRRKEPEEQQKNSSSVTDKRRRDNRERSARHDEREPAEKRRRDEHSRRDDRERPRSRHEREKDRDRDRDRGGERAHDREHRHRESDKDRRDNRAHSHRGDKRGESDRKRDDSRTDRVRHDRTASHSGAGMKDGGPAADMRKDVEQEGAEKAGQTPATGLQNGHASTRPSEDGAAQAKATPKSLEEVLHRKQEAEQEAAKPKFLSRKEREQAALERNKQRADAVRRQAEAARAAVQRPSGGAAAPQQRDGAAQEERLTAKEMQEREKQRAIIRQQYLGQQKQKRRIAKASDKFRFNFDWDASEDTHEEKLHDGTILFGRGKLAGIDMRSQCEAAAQKEKLLLSDMRRARGDMTTEADRKADNARAARAAAIDEDPVLKERHWKEKKREEMTQRDWRIFREDHRISYKNAGKDAPMPYRNWEEMLLPQKLADAVRDLNYTQPSPIQMASAPFGFRQRDVIGLAETGSGKTAAFVLPMLKYIMEQPPMTDALAAEGPYALILAPTRELAQQIEEETISLAKYTGFKTACIVGGASYEVQKGKLRKGAEIVVATPGRLLDCLQKRYAVLNQCAYIVLDEADRMIDLGFEPQVIEVLAAMPASNMKPLDAAEGDGPDAGPTESMIQEGKLYRTTYMFSATMPIAVERIAKRYLRRPVTVVVGATGRAVDSVTQRIEWIDRKQKPSALTRALDTFQTELEHASGTDNDGFKIICFVNNRENSEDVYNQLAKTGKYNVALLHGGKSQEQREECIGGFREGEYDVMIATDVAGRGIDVRDVGLVINYDMPHTIENYTHRIGRTGRAGRKGIAVTFLTSADEKTFFDLKNLLEECKVHVPHQLANHEAAKFKPGQFEQSKKDTTLYAA